MDVAAVSSAGMTGQERAKLVDGARQFEAMLLGEMLKPMQFGGGVEDGGEESQGGVNDTIRSFGTEAVAKAIATAGGFGVARQIVAQVTAERERGNAEKGAKVI